MGISKGGGGGVCCQGVRGRSLLSGVRGRSLSVQVWVGVSLQNTVRKINESINH